MAEDTLVRTGIAGVDDLLHGGIPQTNVILVEGGVGSGKTLFGVEFIYRGITDFSERGIIVVFETSPAKLVRDAATMGWDLPALQAQKKLQIVFTSPQVIEQELRSADSLLLEMALEIGAKRIFIDGIGLLHQSSNVGAPMPFIGPGSYRELLQQLLEGLGREHLAAMLSHESGTYAEAQLTAESAGFLVDTVIRLKRTLQNRRVSRSMEIVKSRGQNYEPGEAHPANTRRQGPGSVSPGAGSFPPQFGAAHLYGAALLHWCGSVGSAIWRRRLRWIHNPRRWTFGSGKNRTWHTDFAGGCAKARETRTADLAR